MGLFDLFKKVSDLAEDLEEVSEKLQSAKDTFSQMAETEEGEEKLEQAKSILSKMVQAKSESAGKRSVSRTAGWSYEFPAGYDFKPDHVRSRGELIHDMKKLIAANFPGYEVKCPVKASQLDAGAHPACAPVNLLLEKGSSKLAIFIVTGSTYKSRNVVGTREILAEKNIPYINFWEEYANDDDYVVARIRYYLS